MKSGDKKKWYVATLIFQSKLTGNSLPLGCEESIHILYAQNADTAYEKALNLGSDGEHSYQNVHNEHVKWEFVGLENLEELFDGELRDGVEIRSRLFDCNDPSSLTQPKDELSVFAAMSNPHSAEYRHSENKDENDEYK